MTTKLTTGLLLMVTAFAAHAVGDCDPAADQGESQSGAMEIDSSAVKPDTDTQVRSTPPRPRHRWPNQRPDGLDDGYTNVEYFR